MKKYSVIDLQGCSFMDYTWEEPMTAQQIRSHLYWLLVDERGYYPDEQEYYHFKEITLDFCADYWEIRFVKLGTKEWAEYNDSDIVDYPF